LAGVKSDYGADGITPSFSKDITVIPARSRSSGFCVVFFLPPLSLSRSLRLFPSRGTIRHPSVGVTSGMSRSLCILSIPDTYCFAIERVATTTAIFFPSLLFSSSLLPFLSLFLFSPLSFRFSPLLSRASRGRERDVTRQPFRADLSFLSLFLPGKQRARARARALSPLRGEDVWGV